MVAYLILIAIAASKRYYIQLLFFIIFVVTNLFIVFLKVKFEQKEKFTNINTYTPSNNLKMSYKQYYDKTMCRGFNTLSDAGKRIDWNNANMQGTPKCRFKDEES